MKTYAQIINEKLIEGHRLSSKCIQRYTGCNNAFDVIHKLRKKYGYDYITTTMVMNKRNNKEFAVYYIKHVKK